MNCPTCSEKMIPNGSATEVYRRGYLSMTVSGIPAVMICPRYNNAVIEWEMAQQIEELVQPILHWADSFAYPQLLPSLFQSGSWRPRPILESQHNSWPNSFIQEMIYA